MSAHKVTRRLRKMEASPFRTSGEIADSKELISLGSGDPDFPTPSHIVESAAKAMNEGFTHYTSTNGLPALREAISEYYMKFGLKTDPTTEVIVTPGSQEALYLTLASTLNPGDEVLIQNPSYVIYAPIIKFLGGKPRPFPLNKEDGFHIDLAQLNAEACQKTKLIILCSPNNPTGTVLTREELKGVADMAEMHDLLVVSDEIYNEFIWNGRHHYSIAALPGMKERTVVIASFSKTFSMTGWRLGYLIADGALVSQMLKLQGNMVLCPAAFVQVAGVSALRGPWGPVEDMRREYIRRKNGLVESLDNIEGVSCPKPEGAFYVFADISKVCESSLRFCDGLQKKKLAVTPGINFGSLGEGYIRIPLVRPVEVLNEAAKRIESYVEELRER